MLRVLVLFLTGWLAACSVAPAFAETSAITGTKGSPGAAQVNVSAPHNTTSVTYVMMGLTGTVTPGESGAVLIIISGDMSNATTTDTVTVQAAYGTGAAPTNAAGTTALPGGGVACGPQVTFTALTGVLTVPFSVSCVVTGLTLGTAYWVDLQVKDNAGTASVTNVGLSVHELR